MTMAARPPVPADWLDGLALWVVTNAAQPLPELHGGFCRQIVTRGVPLWRSSLGLELLHPEQSGVRSLWTADEEVTVTRAQRGIETTSDYLDSPIRIVDETGQPFRRKLAGPVTDLPLLEDYRMAGATEYAIFPLPFIDSDRSAYMSFTTRAEGGFTDAHVALLKTAAELISPYAERRALRRMAIDLLDTYVGHHTGERIYSGQITRGALETIEAAILMCDLRGFTALSTSRRMLSVVELLNAWFDCVANAVGKHDGEILKFMGDGLLVVFRADGDFPGACRRALAAALDARSAVAALNGERDYFGERPIDFVMGIHAGEVAYGNVGSRQRLDFTVLGPAVNYASRLQDLAKRLAQPALISREFAEMAPGEFRDLGVHPLRGIGKAEQVYALPSMTAWNALG